MPTSEGTQRAQAGMRLAFALITAEARADHAAVNVLLADCDPQLISDALRAATAFVAVTFSRRTQADGAEPDRWLETVRAYLLDTETG